MSAKKIAVQCLAATGNRVECLQGELFKADGEIVSGGRAADHVSSTRYSLTMSVVGASASKRAAADVYHTRNTLQQLKLGLKQFQGQEHSLGDHVSSSLINYFQQYWVSLHMAA